MLLQIYWTVVVIFSTLFLIYFNIFVLSSSNSFSKPLGNVEKYVNSQKSSASVGEVIKLKKLVGYSQLKQIELDGQEIICAHADGGAFVNKSETIIAAGGWTKIEDTQVYIHSVNFDDRLDPYHYLRVVAAIKDSWYDTIIYCQIYHDGSTVKFRTTRATVVPIWYKKWNQNDNNSYFNPVLISCRIPLEINHTQVLSTRVALSNGPCDPRPSKVFVIEKKSSSSKHNFTVCVKPLNFEKDISRHLIQWIEINKILGANKFYVFIGKIHQKTEDVLNWYTQNFPGTFFIERFELIGEENYPIHKKITEAIWQRRKFEIVAYNSCFYKNLDSKFVIPLDIDEIIVPKFAQNWPDLLSSIKDYEKYSSLLVQNVYFFEQYDKFPVFFENSQKTKLLPGKGENSKSFISTKNALTIFNHYSLGSLTLSVPNFSFLPLTLVQLNHYKKSCDSIILEKCPKYVSSHKVFDNSISKFRHAFFYKYSLVLARIEKDLGVIIR